MSLINQVLNDLERRGTGSGKTGPVRAVPSSGRGLRQPLVLAAVVTVVLLTALWWTTQRHEPFPPSPEKQPHRVRPKAAPPKPAVHPTAESVPSVAKTLAQSPVAPALNLSFELSSIPLPSPATQHTVPARPHKPQPKPAPKPAAKSHPKPQPAAARKAAQGAPVKVEAEEGYGGPPIKHISPQQQAQDEYSQALALIQQGHKNAAVPHLETTLQLDPDQSAARRTLAGLLLESRRNAEAEQLLQAGLRHDPRQSSLAMLLARLQVERGAMQQALQTLETTMPYADQRADYHAFLAAVLQRLKRNKEAITHYQIALHLEPDSAVWWMGLGISFEAVDDDEDARDAFQHAADMHKLKPQLQAFVERRLKALQPVK